MSRPFRPRVTHCGSSYPNGLTLLRERSLLREAREDPTDQQPRQAAKPVKISKFTLHSALDCHSWYCFSDQPPGALYLHCAETDDGDHP